MTAGPVPQLQQQPAGLNGLSEQHHHSQGQQWQGEDEAPGNGTSLGVQDFRAGSLGAEGRSASLEAPMSSGDRGQAAAAAPSVGKIKLKIRRPWSAGADEYDESWFAEHVGRQPNLRGPIATTDQVHHQLTATNVLVHTCSDSPICCQSPCTARHLAACMPFVSCLRQFIQVA